MLSTWDRYPAGTGRKLRDATQRRRPAEPLNELLAGIDVMMVIAGIALAACVAAILLT